MSYALARTRGVWGIWGKIERKRTVWAAPCALRRDAFVRSPLRCGDGRGAGNYLDVVAASRCRSGGGRADEYHAAVGDGEYGGGADVDRAGGDLVGGSER